MKYLVSTAVVLIAVACVVSLALANPAMLPKHPGYPIGTPTSPVTGQALANDSGQTNAVGESAVIAGAAADTGHVSQTLKESDSSRIKKSTGAGRLPQVQGPEMFSDKFVVKEATKVQ